MLVERLNADEAIVVLQLIKRAFGLTVESILIYTLAVNHIRIAFDGDLDFLDIGVQVQ